MTCPIDRDQAREAEALTVQSLREKVMKHCDEFLSQPIADRSATGLKAVVDAIVSLGEVVERREVRKAAEATAASMRYPFPAEATDTDTDTQPPDPVPNTKGQRKSTKGHPIPGIDT